MPPRLRLSAPLLIAFLGCAPEALCASLIYDVDFSSPTHLVGEPPALGAGPLPRATPTSLSTNTSTATVVAGFGALSDQPLLLEGTSGITLTTVRFVLNDVETGIFDYHTIELDVLVDALSSLSTFSVFVDSTQINRLTFSPFNEISGTGAISVTNSIHGIQTIGSYQAGDVVSVAIDFDEVAQTWSIRLDGTPVFSDDAVVTGQPAVRLVLQRSAATAADHRAAVDNFSITSVPEPGRGALTLSALAALGACVAARKKPEAATG
ncbi:MAG: hypothetical protein JSU66_14790 [Deltaproteobacteria bacterium]|nr:MAG: hypothetical protein JSU66_14790 [Deltaproteobacteria bacterium]